MNATNVQATPLAPKGFATRAQLRSTLPWGVYTRKGSAVLCADGKIRSLSYLAPTADTFFSIPASVRVNGKTVSGYATSGEQVWIKGAKESEPFLSCAIFRKHTNGANASLLPDWPDTVGNDEGAKRWNDLIASAFTSPTV